MARNGVQSSCPIYAAAMSDLCVCDFVGPNPKHINRTSPPHKSDIHFGHHFGPPAHKMNPNGAQMIPDACKWCPKFKPIRGKSEYSDRFYDILDVGFGRLDWVGWDCVGLGWIGWVGLDWLGLDWVWLY